MRFSLPPLRKRQVQKSPVYCLFGNALGVDPASLMTRRIGGFRFGRGITQIIGTQAKRGYLQSSAAQRAVVLMIEHGFSALAENTNNSLLLAGHTALCVYSKLHASSLSKPDGSAKSMVPVYMGGAGHRSIFSPQGMKMWQLQRSVPSIRVLNT